MKAEDIRKLQKHAPEFFHLEQAVLRIQDAVTALNAAKRVSAKAGAPQDYLDVLQRMLNVLEIHHRDLRDWKDEARNAVLQPKLKGSDKE